MKVIQVFVLVSIYYLLPPLWFGNTWADNKVRELATVCLPWQHWTSVLVWFDDVDISVFHSCVVVVVLDLWQSPSAWHLLLSACVWCAAARMSELEL